MRRRKKAKIPTELAGVRKKFDRWRETREKRGPIPEGLWNLAVIMAKKYNLYLVSGVLRLNSGTLKRRLAADSDPNKCSQNSEPSRFVELDVSQIQMCPPITPAECVIELEAPSKGKMTIRLSGKHNFDAASLARLWWSQPQ